jgi:ABC-type uncharacterized transport system substrate-binding protein
MADAVAARKATATIPIVSAALADPASLGLVASVARPGGNVTGIMPCVDGLPAKQIEFPTVYGSREYVEAGGLISYGVDLGWCGRRACDFRAQILTGTAPGDLPIEISTRIEVVINLTTAKALGLAIPRRSCCAPTR